MKNLITRFIRLSLVAAFFLLVGVFARRGSDQSSDCIALHAEF